MLKKLKSKVAIITNDALLVTRAGNRFRHAICATEKTGKSTAKVAMQGNIYALKMPILYQI